MEKTSPKNTNRIAIFLTISVLTVLASLCAGIGGAVFTLRFANTNASALRGSVTNEVTITDETSAITKVAADASPAVVSVVITKDLPVYQNSYDSPFGDGFFSIPRRRQVGTEKRQVGAGSGFIVSKDGIIVTNRHVVNVADADYTVVLSDGSEAKAEILDTDEILDVAIIKIDPKQVSGELTTFKLGDSDAIKIGQRAIAIGNSLGRFSNTVSAGIISGLGRSIVASSEDGSDAESLEGVIQTDASINPGNSGGPLLDSVGNVIGLNVAVASDAENVGFAIPINLVAPAIASVEKFGEIRRPYLGVRYVTLNANEAKERKLSVTQGALVEGQEGLEAVLPNSPAAKAGIKSGDIIVKIDDAILSRTTTLQREIQKHVLGDKITIEFIRDGKTERIDVVLDQVVPNSDKDN